MNLFIYRVEGKALIGRGVTALFLIFYLNLILVFRIIVKAQRLESVTHKRNVGIFYLDL